MKKELKFTNLDKPLWPEDGLTKGDLIEYYRAVAPALLPYLRNRPLTVKRYPNGIEGETFFQKNAPRGTPGGGKNTPPPRRARPPRRRLHPVQRPAHAALARQPGLHRAPSVAVAGRSAGPPGVSRAGRRSARGTLRPG